MASSDATNSYTQSVYQEILLFIEGIQVPYQSISVNSRMEGLPTAFISLSPTLGMEDIARYYQPKVHIFYVDRFTKKLSLLFAGQIDNVSYSKTIQSSHKSISYQCTHRYHLLEQINLIYASYTQENTITNANPGDATVQVNRPSSAYSLLSALRGVSSVGNGVTASNIKGENNSLPPELSGFLKRLSGVTGVFWNLWSQLKQQSYEHPDMSQAMTDMYIPLVESGLQLFERLSGHLVIEDRVESTREPMTSSAGVSVGNVVIPPALKAFLEGGLAADIAIRVLEERGQFSGEVTNLFQMFENFLEGCDYEYVCLASPVETGTSAIDMVFKPKTPFYYSPLCNVLLPQMYESLSIEEADGEMPSRLVSTSMIPLNKAGQYLTFRGPPSVREAIAHGGDLGSTISYSRDRIGQYEYGRGIKPLSTIMPSWLSYFSSYKQDHPDPKGSGIFSSSQVSQLEKGWNDRYGPVNAKLNPWSSKADVADYMRVLFVTADYKYSQAIASTRLGRVEAYFNPYMIAGYPMDVVDGDSNSPSYHGLCSAVTHSFTPTSMSTSISFVGAMSYDELFNYYVPPNHPWLDGVLNLAASQRIVNNPDGKTTADQFYEGVLGVKAAAPDDLYDFISGKPKPVKLGSSGTLETGSSVSIKGSNGGEINPYLSYVGSLSITKRPIETLDKISSRFTQTFIRFEDMDPNVQTRVFGHATGATLLRELGESKFLDY